MLKKSVFTIRDNRNNRAKRQNTIRRIIKDNFLMIK